MIWIFGPIYLIVGIITVSLVLLHSGRGGGFSDMFGGGMSGSAAGSTSMERNLDRLTIVFGLIFTFLTVAMAFMLDS
ncbi:MAG: preprotein translocase subunit SecG [Acidimicrobiales bacterium]